MSSSLGDTGETLGITASTLSPHPSPLSPSPQKVVGLSPCSGRRRRGYLLPWRRGMAWTKGDEPPNVLVGAIVHTNVLAVADVETSGSMDKQG
jgi:hypothetical protein